MLRISVYLTAALLVAAMCVMLLPTSNASAETYDGETHRVYGMDSNPSGAQQNAYDNMSDLLINIIIDLDPDEVVDVIIEDEHFITPTLYVIDFHVVIETGGGGGSGGGGGGGTGGGPN